MTRNGRVRAVSLCAACVLVVGLLALGFTARYAVTATDVRPAAAVLAEIAPTLPAPLAAPPRVPESAPEPEVSSVAPPSAPDTTATEPPPVLITDPHWLSRPRHPERAYPRAAFEAGVEGSVDLDCEVESDGALKCVIADERPRGWGFGEAALTLARGHVMQPPMRDGTPVRGAYRMHVPFVQRAYQ